MKHSATCRDLDRERTRQCVATHQFERCPAGMRCVRVRWVLELAECVADNRSVCILEALLVWSLGRSPGQCHEALHRIHGRLQDGHVLLAYKGCLLLRSQALVCVHLGHKTTLSGHLLQICANWGDFI